MTQRIGLISDTHGLLRPEAVKFLTGVDLIIHAGDVGKPHILATLRTLAPVVAVRGNVDKGNWAAELPATEVVRVGQCLIYILHDLTGLDLDPAAAGFNVVVSGHSHRPSICQQNGVLFVNPGSAGPHRFKLPVSAAWLQIHADTYTAEWVELK